MSHLRFVPLSPTHIEFHHGPAGGVTIAHSIEAAEKVAGAMGYTLEELRDSITPQFAADLEGMERIAPPRVDTTDAEAVAERAAEVLGKKKKK